MIDKSLLNTVSSSVAQLESVQRQLAPVLREIELHECVFKEIERKTEWINSIVYKHQEMLDSSRRWAQALALLQSELPARGWYLTGKEPCRFTQSLAQLAEAGDEKALDAAILTHANRMEVNIEQFTVQLAEMNVRPCCINPLRLFLEARASQNHEVSTLIGVPLIDEISLSLYDGRDFTTKRNKQPKPQMACRTATGQALSSYHMGFVNTFGLLHQDVDTSRLEDEDYFNRSAVLHGQMKREYGPKDTAKVFMVIMFLVMAYDSAHSDSEDAIEDNAD